MNYTKDFVVIFDLDGTLLDTNELIFKSFEYVFKKYMPEKQLSQEELISFLGPTLHDSFRRYFDEEQIDELVDYYREFNHKHHIDYVYVYPTVKETLEYLKKNGYPLAIVTTKIYKVANIGLELFDIMKYFDLVIGMDGVTNVKPDPEGIQKTLDFFNKKQGVMIGDSSSDIKAGKNAGIYTIAVSWSKKPVETLTVLNPNYVVDQMDEIIPLIKEMEV